MGCGATSGERRSGQDGTKVEKNHVNRLPTLLDFTPAELGDPKETTKGASPYFKMSTNDLDDFLRDRSARLNDLSGTSAELDNTKETKREASPCFKMSTNDLESFLRDVKAFGRMSSLHRPVVESARLRNLE